MLQTARRSDDCRQEASVKRRLQAPRRHPLERAGPSPNREIGRKPLPCVPVGDARRIDGSRVRHGAEIARSGPRRRGKPGTNVNKTNAGTFARWRATNRMYGHLGFACARTLNFSLLLDARRLPAASDIPVTNLSPTVPSNQA